MDLARFELSLWLNLHRLRTRAAGAGTRATECEVAADVIEGALGLLGSGLLPVLEFDAAPTILDYDAGVTHYSRGSLFSGFCLLVQPIYVVNEETGRITGRCKFWTLVSAPKHSAIMAAIEFCEFDTAEQNERLMPLHAFRAGAMAFRGTGARLRIIPLSPPQVGDVPGYDLEHREAELALSRTLGLLHALQNDDLKADIASDVPTSADVNAARGRHETPPQLHIRFHLAETQRSASHSIV